MPKILAVDDDRHVLHLIESTMSEFDIDVVSTDNAEAALNLVASDAPDLVLLDNVLPAMTGLEALEEIRQRDCRLPVIIMTGQGSADTTIQAMKLQADDYLTKPLDLNTLIESVQRSLRRADCESVDLRPTTEKTLASEMGNLIAESTAMQSVFKAIGRVAAQDIPVLILGESGTGKELVANAIWQHSLRSERPYLAVNCAALPEALLESELFGHEKGAFTGADQRREGKFEQCDGGTIFLDEVGDMAWSVQAKVLRLLQEQCFQRVGGNKTVKTDVRVIAATNCNLERMCEEGTFRRDLYFRLNGYSIGLPALRHRGGDVELLIDHFLRKYSHQNGKQIQGVSNEAYDALVRYSWPGNVRELQTTLNRAVLDASSTTISIDCLPPQIRHETESLRNATANEVPIVDTTPAAAGPHLRSACDVEEFVEQRVKAHSRDIYGETTQYVDRYVVTTVLRLADGNQSKAAKWLGISRGSLRHKIRTLGIKIDAAVSVE